MSTIAIGDIHGNLRALEDLLNRIIPHICSDDIVVFLGDYIDRGPDSKGCIEAILSFRDSYSGSVATLLGNHEQWLMRTYEDNTSHSWLLGDVLILGGDLLTGGWEEEQSEHARTIVMPSLQAVPVPVFFHYTHYERGPGHVDYLLQIIDLQDSQKVTVFLYFGLQG